MRSCTDLCWKLSGRPPPAMPPPALPPSVGSSDPPQCAGDSSGQHLNIRQQGERMRADGVQEVYSATPSPRTALATPRPNTLPPCTTRTPRSSLGDFLSRDRRKRRQTRVESSARRVNSRSLPQTCGLAWSLSKRGRRFHLFIWETGEADWQTVR